MASSSNPTSRSLSWLPDLTSLHVKLWSIIQISHGLLLWLLWLNLDYNWNKLKKNSKEYLSGIFFLVKLLFTGYILFTVFLDPNSSHLIIHPLPYHFVLSFWKQICKQRKQAALLIKDNHNKHTETYMQTHNKKTKIIIFKQRASKTKMLKQKNMRQRVYKNTMESVLCQQLTDGHNTYPYAWLIFPVKLHWKELIFHFEADVN